MVPSHRVLPLLVVAVAACGGDPTGAEGGGSALSIVAGDNQSQVAGYLVPDTIVVRLVDGAGQPIAFAPIDGAVDATDEAPFAAVTSVDARTRSDGTARFAWRLGLALGAQHLRISSGESPDIASLTVTATATTNRVRALGGTDTSLCAVDATGQLGCWDPLASTDAPPRFVPHPTTERFATMVIHAAPVGRDRGCGVAVTGRVWCFAVDAGEVSDLVEAPGAYPAFASLYTGGGSLEASVPFCGLTTDGVAWCWGDNTSGALGDGSTTSRDAPAPVATELRFVKLAVGSVHACGLTGAGRIHCWGNNASAQLGALASADPVTLPRRINEAIDFSDVAIPNDRSSCGVAIGGGGAWCWGRKEELGIGAVAMSLITGDATHRAIFVSDMPSPTAIMRTGFTTVSVAPGTPGHWWAYLEPSVPFTVALAPRPFVRTLGFRSVAMAASTGLVCGATTALDDAFLCGRVASLTGYPSYQPAPALAGFGVPFP